MYVYVFLLEDFLNVNIYVVSVCMGDVFFYISWNYDEERKKIFLYYEDIEDSGYFYVIIKIIGFFVCFWFCFYCFKVYEYFY